MTNIQTKVCSKCKINQPKENFYPSKTKFGNPSITSHCKTCSSNYFKEIYAKKEEEKIKIRVESLDGEIWRPVRGYSLYRVSNLARVKRVGYWQYKELVGKDVFYEEKLLSQHDYGGYNCVTLYNGEKYKNPTNVYSLVYFAFNPNQEKIRGYEIDHIDGNKLNSKLDNLQYIKSRENSSRRSMFLPKTSKYTGVCWDKKRGLWNAHIRISGKSKYLGRFTVEEEAAQAYQTALANLQNKAA